MTSSAPLSPAILNDLQRMEAGEVEGLKDLSTDTLEMFLADEDLDFITRSSAKTELTIRKHGISIHAIASDNSLTEEQMLTDYNGEAMKQLNKKPDFVYSTGMERVGLPEMLTFYPNPRDCHHVLNEIHKHLLDNPGDIPATENDVAVFNPFDNEALPVFATLLTKEEREWAYEDHTCQVESADTPVMLIHIPTPKGDGTTAYIPQELHGFLSRISTGGN